MRTTPNLAGAHSPAGAPYPNPAGARQANEAMSGLLSSKGLLLEFKVDWGLGSGRGVAAKKTVVFQGMTVIFV